MCASNPLAVQLIRSGWHTRSCHAGELIAMLAASSLKLKQYCANYNSGFVIPLDASESRMLLLPLIDRSLARVEGCICGCSAFRTPEKDKPVRRTNSESQGMMVRNHGNRLTTRPRLQHLKTGELPQRTKLRRMLSPQFLQFRSCEVKYKIIKNIPVQK